MIKVVIPISEYIRLDNETEEAAIFRICSLKDKIGTWQDVANVLNEILEKHWNESTYRKKYAEFNKMLGANKDIITKDDNYLKQLECEKAEIRKERAKLQTLNIERSRIDRAEARQELFYEYIGSVITSLPVPDTKFHKTDDNNSGDIEYLCCISDTHYGAKFVTEINEYSPEIFTDRLLYLFNKLVNFIENYNLKKLHIACLGDTIQGMIHLSDLKLNDSSMVKSIVDFSRLIAVFLNSLSEYVNIEYYHVPSSNHTQIRPFSTRSNEIPDEDLEYVISHYISDLCKNNDRINIHLPNENVNYIRADIRGNDIYLMHGHTIKKLETALDEFSQLINDNVDYLILGHYHRGEDKTVAVGSCNDKEVLVCPSFVGQDPYAMQLMKASHSAVKIFGFDFINGHTESYKIILD